MSEQEYLALLQRADHLTDQGIVLYAQHCKIMDEVHASLNKLFAMEFHRIPGSRLK